MAENPTQKMIREAVEQASEVCSAAYASTPSEYRRYITRIKSNKKLADRVYAPIETPYITVDGRVKMAVDEHREANAALVIETMFEQSPGGEQTLCKAIVTSAIRGTRTAHARVVFGGTNADSTNPMENAETSAIGRALGFLGYGLLGTGIASYEEMLGADAARDKSVGGYTIPEGKRALLAGKLSDLGKTEAEIADIMAKLTSPQQTERAITKATQQWEEKAQAAAAVLDAGGEPKAAAHFGREPQHVPTEYLHGSKWNPIFEMMTRVGVRAGDFEAYLLDEYHAKSMQSLPKEAVGRYANLTATEEQAKGLAETVRKALAKMQGGAKS